MESGRKKGLPEHLAAELCAERGLHAPPANDANELGERVPHLSEHQVTDTCE